MNYITTLLSKVHKREAFKCGKPVLDDYFYRQVSQDIRKKISVCFVLVTEDFVVKGFYTLSNASIPLEMVPDEIRNKMPRAYLHLPTTLLGRLAVDEKYRNQGLGALLLIDALKRCYESSVKSIGSIAVIVDPLDEAAANFYRKYGFIDLPDGKKMCLPMKTIAQLFK